MYRLLEVGLIGLRDLLSWSTDVNNRIRPFFLVLLEDHTKLIICVILVLRSRIDTMKAIYHFLSASERH